ncbi:hypothetical protein BCR44DRAFT_44268, partial [Catenaria anguillulae PL171]
MLAIDNGSNTNFATTPSAAAGMPLMHVGPISYWGSANAALYSGASYAYAYYPNFQYAALTVNDTTNSTCLRMNGCSLGLCYLSQTVCINATNPSIVRTKPAQPSSATGSLATVPMFPAYVWTTVVSFGIITLLVFGLIGRKVAQAMGISYRSPSAKMASYGYGAGGGQTRRKRAISTSGKSSKARKASPNSRLSFGKSRKIGPGGGGKGVSVKSVKADGNDGGGHADGTQTRRKSSRSHSPLMTGVEGQLAEYVGGGEHGGFGGGIPGQQGPSSSIAATSVMSQNSRI